MQTDDRRTTTFNLHENSNSRLIIWVFYSFIVEGCRRGSKALVFGLTHVDWWVTSGSQKRELHAHAREQQNRKGDGVMGSNATVEVGTIARSHYDFLFSHTKVGWWYKLCNRNFDPIGNGNRLLTFESCYFNCYAKLIFTFGWTRTCDSEPTYGSEFNWYPRKTDYRIMHRLVVVKIFSLNQTCEALRS